MNAVLWILAGVLAAMFLAAGLMKVATPREKLAANMAWMASVSEAQLKALGTVELLGAIGLIVPRALNIAPVLTPIAAVGCAMVMVGATLLHGQRKEFNQLPMTVVLLVVSVIVAAGRF